MKITDEIRQEIIEALQKGEKRQDTIKRLGLSKSTYDFTVQIYRLATEGNLEALNKLSKSNGPTVQWAIKATGACPLPKQSRQTVNRSYYRFIQKICFIKELFAAACCLEQTDAIPVMRFLTDQLETTILIQKQMTEEEDPKP